MMRRITADDDEGGADSNGRRVCELYDDSTQKGCRDAALNEDGKDQAGKTADDDEADSAMTEL